MTFLQPFILWGLPLLLLPVIIHLVNRLRHRPRQWAAMRFLRAANQSSINRAKLREFLVLLFRVLAVCALIFFLSRPLAGGWLGWALAPAPEAVVLVLDRSPSMETQSGNSGKSAREQALDLWSDALKNFESSRLVLVDNGSDRPRELPGPSALKEPAYTASVDNMTDMPLLLQRAYQYLVDSKSGGAEIWIASDLQQSNWQPSDAQWGKLVAQFNALPQKVRFRLLTFDGPARNNVSISLADALRTTRNQQSALDVTLNLEQTAPGGDSPQLRVVLNGSESQAAVDFKSESLRWRNSFALGTKTNAGWAAFHLPADGNSQDNDVYFAWDNSRPVTSVIVSERVDSVRPIRIAASDLDADKPQIPPVIGPGDLAGANLDGGALIVWNESLPEGVTAGVLENFIRSGGEVLFLPSEKGGSTAFQGMAWTGVTSAGTNETFAVGDWNELDGPLAKTEEGLGVPLKQLEIWRRGGISGDGTILATFADGAPLLARKILGKGAFYFFATSAAPSWSSLSEGPVLVPMLQRMLASGSRRSNSAVVFTCDEVTAQQAGDWASLDGTKSDPRSKVGIYQAAGKFFAVNRPSEEADLQRANPAAIKALFGNLPFQLHEEQGKSGDRLQGEVWRLFLTFMLIFLIVEGLLVLPPKPRRNSADDEGARPARGEAYA